MQPVVQRSTSGNVAHDRRLIESQRSFFAFFVQQGKKDNVPRSVSVFVRQSSMMMERTC